MCDIFIRPLRYHSTDYFEYHSTDYFECQRVEHGENVTDASSAWGEKLSHRTSRCMKEAHVPRTRQRSTRNKYSCSWVYSTAPNTVDLLLIAWCLSEIVHSSMPFILHLTQYLLNVGQMKNKWHGLRRTSLAQIMIATFYYRCTYGDWVCVEFSRTRFVHGRAWWWRDIVW